MICSVPGVADGAGGGDFAAAAELFAVGADDGAGVWPDRVAAIKNEMAAVAVRFNIAVIVSRSPRSEQYRADNDSLRTG